MRACVVIKSQLFNVFSLTFWSCLVTSLAEQNNSNGSLAQAVKSAAPAAALGGLLAGLGSATELGEAALLLGARLVGAPADALLLRRPELRAAFGVSLEVVQSSSIRSALIALRL